MKKKNNSLLYKKRLAILDLSKKIVVKNGWNQNTFTLIAYHSNFSINQINILFPRGYDDLIKFAMDQINFKLENNFKKNSLIRQPIHKRIRTILISKINLMEKNKFFYKKTFFHLFLPKNSKLFLIKLYESVDLMWFIAGDRSTDFNFYSKRMILSGIYVRVLLCYFNNDDFSKVEQVLDKSLNAVSKIPRYKEKFEIFKQNIPNFFKIIKSF